MKTKLSYKKEKDMDAPTTVKKKTINIGLL